MRAVKRRIIAGVIAIVETVILTGCETTEETYQELVSKAKSEGQIESLAMPDAWANWEETWKDLNAFYEIQHTDTDMNSAQELELFEEGTGDMGDIGYSYAEAAEKNKLTLPYKTSDWDELPKWAKDDNGDWVVTYTGTIAFMVKDADKEVSLSWKELLDSDATVEIAGDVETASLAQCTVYAAAVAMGGGPDNIQPGIDFFKKLAQEGRLSDVLHNDEELKDCDIDVVIKWDFIGLSYRDTLEKYGKKYAVCIPSDGSVTIGYASVINKKARHPEAAKLAREYILSDAGQLNLASGYATPIRPIVLPEELEERRIDRSQYKDEMVESGLDITDELVQDIIKAWNEQVIPILEEKGRAE